MAAQTNDIDGKSLRRLADGNGCVAAHDDFDLLQNSLFRSLSGDERPEPVGDRGSFRR